jgi:homoaconitase/3-isopropylmalate dehydratase large subunit
MRNQTQQTEAQKQELQRFHQQAANQLGQMTGDITSLPSRISSFIERWASAKSDALAAGFKAGTAAMKREIASKLGITIGTLKALRESFRSSLASELGITTGELRHLNRTFNFNEEKIAAKLGISVEQLRALKEEARKTAANTTKIKNKDWTPTITVPVSVKSTFSVSGRAVAQATEKFWSINRPRVT